MIRKSERVEAKREKQLATAPVTRYVSDGLLMYYMHDLMNDLLILSSLMCYHISLYEACASGNDDDVTWFLDHGVDPDACDPAWVSADVVV